MNRLVTSLVGAAALCGFLTAAAPTVRAQPVGGVASAPALHSLRYRSAFADYKPYQDIKSGDWKAMNDAVGESGGPPMEMPMAMPMRSALAPSPAVSGASRPAMPGHGAHQMHMPGGKR